MVIMANNIIYYNYFSDLKSIKCNKNFDNNNEIYICDYKYKIYISIDKNFDVNFKQLIDKYKNDINIIKLNDYKIIVNNNDDIVIYQITLINNEKYSYIKNIFKNNHFIYILNDFLSPHQYYLIDNNINPITIINKYDYYNLFNICVFYMCINNKTNLISYITIYIVHNKHVIDKVLYLNNDGDINDNDNIYCKNEQILLLYFLTFLQKYKINLICSYNIFEFSCKYILDKCVSYNINMKKFNVFIKTINYGKTTYFDNLINIDILSYFKKTTNSTSLKNIIYNVLKINTNKNDLQISYYIYKILKKCDILKYYIYLSNIIYVNLNECSVLSIKKIITYLMSVEFYKNKYFLYNNKDIIDKLRYTCKGGYVNIIDEYKIYDDVYVFDFNSLYPSIIISLNLCYTTLLGKINSEDVNKIKKYESELDELDIDFCKILVEFDDNDNKLNKYYVYFNQNKSGILPQILLNLINKRKQCLIELKTDLNDDNKIQLNCLQLIYKNLSNSIYGFLMTHNNILKDYYIASTITAFGRNIITNINNFITLDIIYNDTDSIMISNKNINTDMFIKTVNMYISEYINNMSKCMQNKNIVYLDFDIYYKKFILFKKKKYIGYNDNKTVYKGITALNKINCKYIHQLYKNIIDKVFNNHVNKKNYKDVLNNLINEMCANYVSSNNLCMNYYINKNIEEYKQKNIFINLMIYLQKERKMHVNNKLKYIYVCNKHTIEELEYFQSHNYLYEIDKFYYFKNIFKNHILEVFKLFNDNDDELNFIYNKILSYHINYFNVIKELKKVFLFNFVYYLKNVKI